MPAFAMELAYQGGKGALAPSKNNLPLSFEGEGD